MARLPISSSFVLTVLACGVSLSSAAAGAKPAAPRHGIAFLRAGDLWLAPRAGSERPLTRGAKLRGLAAEGRRVAVVAGRSGDVVLFVGPGWRARPFTREERFVGPPCWRPGTRELLVARERGPEGRDDGLWRLDTGRRVRRQLLDAARAELSIHSRVRLSPSGSRAAAGGETEVGLAVRVRDLRSETRWSPLAAAPLRGGSDFDWLGEERLLVAAAPVPVELAASTAAVPARAVAIPAAGLFALDLRSGRLTPWLYPRGTEVLRVARAPGRHDRYAVGLGRVRAHSAVPPMARRIELVDGRAKARRLLPLPAPAHVAGFSPDGRWLLLLSLRRLPGRDLADAVAVELATGRRRTLARGVAEAAWVAP